MMFATLLYLCFSFFKVAEASLFDRFSNFFGSLFEKDRENLEVDRYIVTFKNKEGRTAGIKAASKFLFELDKINAVVVTLPKVLVEKLSNNPNIESIEEDELIAPTSSVEMMRRLRVKATTPDLDSSIGNDNDNNNGKQHRRLEQVVPYGIPMVQADQVAYSGGMRVCIIDWGYYVDHEDLPKDNVDGFDGRGKRRRSIPIFSTPVSIGYGGRFMGAWDEDFRIGSHAAGIIAAVDNDIGVVGVAPGVDLYIVNPTVSSESGAYSSGVSRAVGLCEDAGAKIVTVNFVSGLDSDKPETKGASLRAFNRAYRNGMLIFGAAGDRNSTFYLHPASYDSVVSVGAVDENQQVTVSSQKHDRVELVATGDEVLSTAEGGTASTLEVNITSGNSSEVESRGFLGSSIGEAVGQLEFCGLGDGGTPCEATGKICLVGRGEITFANKVKFCEDSGGIATIIYNNLPGLFTGIMGGFQSTRPVVMVTAEDGEYLKTYAGEARVSTQDFPYAFLSGTERASSYAAGVAALVWSKHPQCSNEQIRNALQVTAKDLGVGGKDDSYGYGLVQAKAAVNYLDANACS